MTGTPPEPPETPDTPETPAADPADGGPSRRRRWIVVTVIAVVVAIALAVGGFLWWFFRDDAPPEVDIADAAAQVAGDTAVVDTTPPASDGDAPSDTAPDPAATDPAMTDGATDDPQTTDPVTSATSVAPDDATEAASGVDGSWTVDTTIGEFSFEDSTGTFVGFRVAEELSGLGSTTAVGRTPAVTGTLDIEGTTVTDVAIEADMTQITTNDGRRDDNVQRALETGDFPTAAFALTAPIELGDAALTGEPVSVEGSGDLTIHGVTRAVTIPLDAQLVDDTIVVVGSLDITFSDYGVEVPSAPIVLSASDDGPIELQLFFTR